MIVPSLASDTSIAVPVPVPREGRLAEALASCAAISSSSGVSAINPTCYQSRSAVRT
jgi:hypothetical protein